MKTTLQAIRPRHFLLEGALAPGTVVADGAVVREVIHVLGSLRGRVRAKLSVAGGTLRFYFKRPGTDGRYTEDDSQRHSSSNPSDLALADALEAARDIDFYGEGILEIEYTDNGSDAGSTIDYIAVSLL